MLNFSTSSSMSESTRGWREPLSLNSGLVAQIWVFPDNWVYAVDSSGYVPCLGQSSRCHGVLPTATFRAKMSWEVPRHGNGWDDCWCMNVEFPRNYPPFSQLVWGWDDCWMYECLVPSKLSSIQSTRLRMRWLLGVWMLSYPPFSQLVWGWDDCWVYECWFTLHSVNSVEDRHNPWTKGWQSSFFLLKTYFPSQLSPSFCLTICFLTHPSLPLSHILFTTKFSNFCLMYIVGHFLCSPLMLLELPFCFSMF
jgi:hypothetical protein